MISCYYDDQEPSNKGWYGYRFAELGPGEGLQSPSVCDCCEREDLKRTIKLINPEGRPVWYGCGCAARAMGTSAKAVRAAKRAAEDKAYEAAQEAQRARWMAVDAAWQAFLDLAAGPGARYDQIRALGGMAKARARYKSQSAAS